MMPCVICHAPYAMCHMPCAICHVHCISTTPASRNAGMSLSHMPITFEQMRHIGNALHLYLERFRDRLYINRETLLLASVVRTQRHADARIISRIHAREMERSLQLQLIQNQENMLATPTRHRIWPTRRENMLATPTRHRIWPTRRHRIGQVHPLP